MKINDINSLSNNCKLFNSKVIDTDQTAEIQLKWDSDHREIRIIIPNSPSDQAEKWVNELSKTKSDLSTHDIDDILSYFLQI